MSIILPLGRPAIEIVNGSYDSPEEPWSQLAEPATKSRLEQAISAVGRVDFIGDRLEWGGTAFVVGPDLLLTNALVALTLEQTDQSYSFKPGVSAVIDFGHERAPSNSVRVTVEEIVDFDRHLQLVRAKLPSYIVPLKLSLAGYEALKDRPVAVIGYPAWDSRIEASVMQKILGGVVDVKRVLPGFTLGRAAYQGICMNEALVHDCTTTGGCGGAPIVDLATGLVVGIHLGGNFLKTNYAILAAALRANANYTMAGVTFAAHPALKGEFVAPKLISISPENVASIGHLESAPAVPDLAASTDEDEVKVALEAIVLRKVRPALLAENWKKDVPDVWKNDLKLHEQRIDLALRAVGKLIKDVDQEQWLGTAFLVGEKLALTASLGLNDFVDGAGAQATLKPGAKAAIDFSEALGKSPRSAMAMVAGVKFIHPFFQLALLELESTPEGAATLTVASQLPSQLANRRVVLLSFAAESAHAENDLIYRVYQERRGRLFVQPGNARQVGEIPGVAGLPALVHDCASTVGAPGGPVLDLGTGYVIGVQTHHIPLESTMAQAVWEFARDPYVWKYNIGFWPNPRPVWLAEWDVHLQQHQQQEPFDPPARVRRWTVDDVPIDWRRPEPKALERLLFSSIDPQMALYAAENAGLQLGLVNSSVSPMLLWREILKKASLAGVLRPMLSELAVANAGIATKLREFL